VVNWTAPAGCEDVVPIGMFRCDCTAGYVGDVCEDCESIFTLVCSPLVRPHGPGPHCVGKKAGVAADRQPHDLLTSVGAICCVHR
jgi:hypothetical protein